MKIGFVTYSDKKYEKNRSLLNEKAKGVFDYTFPYSLKDVDEKFYENNKRILQQSRGIGYWLWKSYIIQKALSEIDNNDIIFYLDSGDHFTPNVKQYIYNIMRTNDIVLVPGSWPQKMYTKRDCFILMNCDNEKYWESIQVEAGIIVVKKTEYSIKIVDEWLEWCKNENILTDIPNICGKDNFSCFIDHRHDQSVLSNLAKKYNILLDNGIRKFVTCNVVGAQECTA